MRALVLLVLCGCASRPLAEASPDVAGETVLDLSRPVDLSVRPDLASSDMSRQCFQECGRVDACLGGGDYVCDGDCNDDPMTHACLLDCDPTLDCAAFLMCTAPCGWGS